MASDDDKSGNMPMEGDEFKLRGDKKIDRDFFKSPHPGFVGLGIFTLAFVALATFAPSRFPPFLGPLARLGEYLGTNYPTVFRVLSLQFVIVHSFEAFVARRKCREIGLTDSATHKWMLSTLFFGYPSLGMIIKYAKNAKPQRDKENVD